MIKRAKVVAPRPEPRRTVLDRAAIEACRAAYGGRCACRDAKQPVCKTMFSVAFSVLAAAAPAVLRELERRGEATRPS